MNNISYKVWYWFYYKSPVYINLNIFKPIKYWWKARKVFRRPHISKTFQDAPYTLQCHNKLFHLSFNELGYKMKYSEPRFEWCPYIYLVIFNKFEFLWLFTSPVDIDHMGNMIYWESILWYVLTKDVKQTYEMNIWNKSIKDKEVYTCLDMLKPTYKKLIENGIRNT